MTQGNPTKLRIWIFRGITLVVLPILFFVGLESGLRLLPYGYSPDFALVCEQQGRQSLCSNNRFAWQFFPRQIARTSTHFTISLVKQERTYRIFVLGASAAMGDPEPSYGFSRMLGVLLQSRYPGINFEIVNTAITAINSHVVLPIAEEVAQLEPDLFIIYLGNNEVVGPYGAGTVFAPISLSRDLIRAGIKLKATRIGQALGQLLKGQEETAEPVVWRGMEMFLEQQVRFDAPGLEKVYSYFRKNLNAIIDQADAAGAQVILSTVGTNLKDSAPFASLHQVDLDANQLTQWEKLYAEGIAFAEMDEHAQAIARFNTAAGIDEQYADLHYRIGLSFLEISEVEKAAHSFVLARDYDVLRFRADSRINEIIRRTAQDRADILLLDTDRLFSAASPVGIPGNDLFYEHVHMKLRGNYLIAEKLLGQIEQLLAQEFSNKRSTDPALSMNEVARRLAFSPFDRLRIEEGMLARLGKPPFTNQLDHQARIELLQKQFEDLGKIQKLQARSTTINLYRQALKQRNLDPWLYYNYGIFLEEGGEPILLVEQFNKVLDFLPEHVGALDKLAAALTRLGRYEEALNLSQKSLGLMPYDNRAAYYNLASAQANLGQLDESSATFERLLRNEPAESVDTYNQIGRLQIQRKMFSAAVETYRKAVEFNRTHGRKRNPDIHYHLGYALKRTNRDEEARTSFNRAIIEYQAELTESSAPAVLHRALGFVLVESGDLETAADHFAQVLDLEPEVLSNHYNLMKAYEAQGLLAQAVIIAERSVALLDRQGKGKEAVSVRNYLRTLNLKSEAAK